MPIFPPIPLIRKNLIINKLTKCGAFSPETAKTLDQAGVFNPHAFGRITDKLVQKGAIHQTPDGKYYLPK